MVLISSEDVLYYIIWQPDTGNGNSNLQKTVGAGRVAQTHRDG